MQKMAKRELAEIIYQCFEAGYTKEELLDHTQSLQHHNPLVAKRMKVIASDFIRYQPKTLAAYAEQFDVSVSSIGQNVADIGKRFYYLVNHTFYTGKKTATKIDPGNLFYYLNDAQDKMNSRIINALGRAGLLDLDRLFHTSQETLYRIRNLGPKALEKIAEIKLIYGIYKGYIQGVENWNEQP